MATITKTKSRAAKRTTARKADWRSGPRPATQRAINRALVRLLKDGPQTRADLRLTLTQHTRMLDDGLITRARSVVRTGERGRPAFKWRLTDRGRGRARRLRKNAK